MGIIFRGSHSKMATYGDPLGTTNEKTRQFFTNLNQIGRKELLEGVWSKSKETRKRRKINCIHDAEESEEWEDLNENTDFGEKLEDKDDDVLTREAEAWRMKLIKEFRILENLDEMGNTIRGLEAPRYYPTDLEIHGRRRELITDHGHALVKFNKINRKHKLISKFDRMKKKCQMLQGDIFTRPFSYDAYQWVHSPGWKKMVEMAIWFVTLVEMASLSFGKIIASLRTKQIYLRVPVPAFGVSYSRDTQFCYSSYDSLKNFFGPSKAHLDQYRDMTNYDIYLGNAEMTNAYCTWDKYLNLLDIALWAIFIWDMCLIKMSDTDITFKERLGITPQFWKDLKRMQLPWTEFSFDLLINICMTVSVFMFAEQFTPASKISAQIRQYDSSWTPFWSYIMRIFKHIMPWLFTSSAMRMIRRLKCMRIVKLLTSGTKSRQGFQSAFRSVKTSWKSIKNIFMLMILLFLFFILFFMSLFSDPTYLVKPAATTRFANFFGSMTVMFQLLTLDNYKTVIVEVQKVVLMYYGDDEYKQVYVVLGYTLTFFAVIILSLIIKNVIAAILVSDHCDASHAILREKMRKEGKEEFKKGVKNVSKEITGQEPDADGMIEGPRRCCGLLKGKKIKWEGGKDADQNQTAIGISASADIHAASMLNINNGLDRTISGVSLQKIHSNTKSHTNISMARSELAFGVAAARKNNNATDQDGGTTIEIGKVPSAQQIFADMASKDVQERKDNQPTDPVRIDQVDEEEYDESFWDFLVQRHLDYHDDKTKGKQALDTVWPRTELFQYMETMEAIMESLHERQEICRLLGISLLNMNDAE